LKPDILYEDDGLVAVNKPSGVLTLPDRFDTALDSLKGILSGRYTDVFTVHRLDRDTSGLILFAKTAESQRYHSRLFEERGVEKTYLGLVSGRPVEMEGTVDQPIAENPRHPGRMMVDRKGKASVTHYRVLETLGRHSWLSFRIETGRTHQIRVHMRHLGHPIACDPIYGSPDPILLSSVKRNFKPSSPDGEERPLLARLALHAWRLSFTGMDGRPMDLEAPLPKDLDACLKQLRKWTH
jgi:23S rRNA pseudouridine955/2504/2580 synthase/23S rRNA pseudouridine1911/1915/1917 synthase